MIAEIPEFLMPERIESDLIKTQNNKSRKCSGLLPF